MISKSTRPTADGIEHSGVFVGPSGTTYRHVDEITLQPDEGTIQRRPLRPLEPGQYKLAIKLPRGFEDLNPDPVTFTVAPR